MFDDTDSLAGLVSNKFMTSRYLYHSTELGAVVALRQVITAVATFGDI